MTVVNFSISTKTSLYTSQFPIFTVVVQAYEAEADNEYVIRGNAAIMKCEIPSYVSDFIVVDMWADSEGGSYYPNEENYGTFFVSRPFK